MSDLSLVDLIAKKRDGHELSDLEIERLVEAFVDGELTDYQMSAWLMAGYHEGLSERETTALMSAMLGSGERLVFADTDKPIVDKHSTGGVGDKTSLCLMPLAAACGLLVPSIAGRGLGHTGGTLDKLASIPGFRWDLGMKEFVQIVESVGCAIGGQTGTLAPADKRMYALRDVTATVESVPLIVASILSKKLAEGLDALVLDVKVGVGAFMHNLEEAQKLGRALVRVGQRARVNVSALVTDMDVPLGNTIGNALEVREAIDVLRGNGPADTRELTVALGAEMLVVGGLESARPAAKKRIEDAIADGSGLEKFRAMVAAQGGDIRTVDDPSRLPQAAVRMAVRAEEDGIVQRCQALTLGRVAMQLGAGRSRADDEIDLAAGVELSAKPGDKVSRGEPLAWLHASSRKGLRERVKEACSAYTIGQRALPAVPLILGHVRPAGDHARAVMPPSSRRTFERRSKLP